MNAGRFALLASAGILALVVVQMFGRGSAVSDDMVSEVVAPVVRARPQEVVTTSVPAERLNDGTIHNPFGALNLPSPAASATLGAPKVDKAAERKAAADAKARARWLAMGPPVPPPPPPPPVAPPLPFTAVGAISGEGVTDGKLVAFIKQQDQLLLVRAGDTIGQAYRVESVTSQRIEFTYLPLMQRQVLALAP